MSATVGRPVPGSARPTAAARLFRRRVLVPVDGMLVMTALVCAAIVVAGGTIPQTVQVVPFAVSMVLLGLPHGALDAVVPARLAGRRFDSRSAVTVLIVYAAVGGAQLLLWQEAPGVAFVGFVLLTWFHWGQGDLFLAEWAGRARSRPRAGRALHLTVRGAIPMLVPFVAHPAAVAGVEAATTRVFGGTVLPATTATGTRIVIAVVVVAVLVVERISAARPGSGIRWRVDRAWWYDTAETILLVVFFVAVPPVLAVGLYFCLWHAVRHIIRLQLLDAGSAPLLRAARFGAAFGRFAVQAAPLTAAALVLLAVLALTVPRASTPSAALGVYLVLISVLTAPHVVIVAWMDGVQHVWAE